MKKANELKKELVAKITELTQYNDDLKKFLIDKDFQINELNSILESKEKEILILKEKNKTLNSNTVDNEIKLENNKLTHEVNKLNGKVNDIELKLYKANDDKKSFERQNKILKEQNSKFIEDVSEIKSKYEEDLNIKNLEIIDLKNKILSNQNFFTEKENILKELKEKDIIIKELQEKNFVCENIKKIEEKSPIKDIKSKESLEEVEIQNKILLNKEEEILQLNLINSQISKEKDDLAKKNFNLNFSVEQFIEKLNFEVEKNKQISEEIVDLIKLNTKLDESIENLENKNKNFKKIITNLTSEKIQLEELLIKQDEKVNSLALKFKIIEKKLKEKNKELYENDENTIKLVNIIEQQKNSIENLSKVTNFSKSTLSIKDEIVHKKLISDKDIQINNLKLYNDSLKNDINATLRNSIINYQEELKRFKFKKINNQENEFNPTTSVLMLNKKIKIVNKDLNRNPLTENINKNRNILTNKSLDKINLPDINKNFKIGNEKNKIKNYNEINTEVVNSIYKSIESKKIKVKNKKKSVEIDYDNTSSSNGRYLNDGTSNNNENKKKSKENNNFSYYPEITTENNDEENEQNLNEISDMMKKILYEN